MLLKQAEILCNLLWKTDMHSLESFDLLYSNFSLSYSRVETIQPYHILPCPAPSISFDFSPAIMIHVQKWTKKILQKNSHPTAWWPTWEKLYISVAHRVYCFLPIRFTSVAGARSANPWSNSISKTQTSVQNYHFQFACQQIVSPVKTLLHIYIYIISGKLASWVLPRSISRTTMALRKASRWCSNEFTGACCCTLWPAFLTPSNSTPSFGAPEFVEEPCRFGCLVRKIPSGQRVCSHCLCIRPKVFNFVM